SPTRTVAPTATPLHTETLRPVTPTPSPTPPSTKQAVMIFGTVHHASGAAVTNACVTTSPTAPTSTTACYTRTTNGTYSMSASMSAGQTYTITLYAYYTDPVTGALSGGYASAPLTAPTTVMPAITLTPKR